MNEKKTLKIFLIVLLSFAIYYVLSLNFKFLKLSIDKITHQGLISYILTYFIIGIPLFIGTYVINQKTNIFQELGLGKNIFNGILLSLLFTIPMFLGGFIFFRFNSNIDIQTLIAGTLVAGFMEELFFRGFLFGQLFKNTRLGFIPSIILGALIFASGHLYQSQDASELVGIFLVTFSGAIFFAWLFVEWNYNLWVPIFTHTFMNLSWDLFDVDNSALGDTKANIFRALTILIAIVFTITFKKRKNQKMTINKHTLLLKKKEKGILPG